jgi:hypothetical protein
MSLANSGALQWTQKQRISWGISLPSLADLVGRRTAKSENSVYSTSADFICCPQTLNLDQMEFFAIKPVVVGSCGCVRS